MFFFFFFQAEDGIRDHCVTGVQTCALPIYDQKARGPKGEPWSGVRNHQAKLNMMAMKKGEQCFFYHSGKERRILGIVEVISDYKPDPTDETGKFGLVDVRAVQD